MLVVLTLFTKIVVYVGLLGSAGLCLQAYIAGAQNRRLIAGFALLLSAAVCLRLFLMNAELAGGLEDSFDFSLFRWVWTPNRDQTLAYVIGALVLFISAALGLKWLSVPGLITVFAGAGLGGHTHGMDTPGLNPIFVSIHVAIAAFWVTAPIVLWPVKTMSDTDLLQCMKRFSAVAIWSIPTLIAGGVWLSLQIGGSVSTLVESDYGRLLAIKFGLALVALGVGAVNKFWVTLQINKDPAAGRRLLHQTLTVDCLLFIGIIIAIASATSLTGPGA